MAKMIESGQNSLYIRTQSFDIRVQRIQKSGVQTSNIGSRMGALLYQILWSLHFCSLTATDRLKTRYNHLSNLGQKSQKSMWVHYASKCL